MTTTLFDTAKRAMPANPARAMHLPPPSASGRLKHAVPLEEHNAASLRLRRQWAVLRAGDDAPAGWTSRTLPGGYVLRTHPETPTETSGGGTAGLILLGLALNPAYPGAGVLAPPPWSTAPDHVQTVAFLRNLGGTYAVVRYDAHGIWLYTDPAAMLGVYYSNGRAASSPSLLPGLARDPAIDDAFPFGGADDWYPGSLCPFVGVKALLANHCLDVARGSAARFWPSTEFKPVGHDEGVHRACDILRGMMHAAVAAGPVLASLTGGKDSRVVLAAAKDVADRIEYFTLDGPGVKRCDVDLAGRLAERFGLDHRFVPIPDPPDWLLDRYDEMTAGLAVGARRQIAGACRTLASPSYLHANGNLGALAKSFFWHSPRPRSVRRSALAKEFTRKPPCITAALDEWLASLPPMPATAVYSLMYLEQRGGRWMGPGETAASLYYQSFTPFNHRVLFEILAGMPAESLYGGKLLVGFVEHLWPELLEVPYCRATRNWGTYLPKSFKERVKRVLGK